MIWLKVKNILGEKYFKSDFSEIEGFDNLRNPEGIIKNLQNSIANIYNSLDIMNFVLILLGNIVGAKICYYGGVKS